MPNNPNCPIKKIDSNITGLRYAVEECPGQLPVAPVWNLLEPNTYSDFSAENTPTPRTPINNSRQNQKGTITDVSASSGFNHDLTMNNLTELLEGFFFADAREKVSTQPLNGTAVEVEVGASNTYAVEADVNIEVGDLIFASGFRNNANNGLKNVTTVSADGLTITVSQTLVADAVVMPAQKLQVVGKTYADGGSITVTPGEMPILALASLPPVIRGEWIFVGGNGANTGFVNNKGFARVGYIDTVSNALWLDKTSWTPVTETIATPLQLFMGTVIRNEDDPDLIVKRSFQLERTLGKDADGQQAEYSVGAVANELTVNIPSADKVNVDMTFIALYNDERTGEEGLKAGSRPNPSYDRQAINTSTDFSRVNLSILKDDSTMPDQQLFAYATEMTITINNNVSASKAIGTLGAIDTTAGSFDAGGSVTAYFTTVEALRAIRNNSNISLDTIIKRDNKAQVWDIPLLYLSGGQVAVEKDSPVTIPLDLNGVESPFNYTMMYVEFPFVPD